MQTMPAGQKIKNFDALSTTGARRLALEIAEAGFAAVDTRAAMRRKLRMEGDTLVVDDVRVPLAARRVVYVGIGKCAAAAAEAIEGILGAYLDGGIALDVAMPPLCKTERIECFLGTHPEPSEANEAGTARILELLHSLAEGDLAIILVSGGGSTLLCHPTGALTCTSEAALLRELFNTGASIQEINTLRKHISPARGGGLARAAQPAEVLGLVISDVPGNDLSSIASGPTVLDTTTVADAMAIVERYALKGIHADDLLETAKDAAAFERVRTRLLLSNKDALEAMGALARSRGLASTILTDAMTGEAKERAHDLLAALRERPRGSALLWGGETTVTITGDAGAGGRNQEFALAVLAELRDGELALPFASDGRDNSPAAGAIADSETLAHANAEGLSAAAYLERHDSYDFFHQTGDALSTGYTGSNISDLGIALTDMA